MPADESNPREEHAICLNNPDMLLTGTPYLMPGDEESRQQAIRILRRSLEAGKRAQQAQVEIKKRAKNAFSSLAEALRFRIVSESNRIEGYEWSVQDVSSLAKNSADILSLPSHELTRAIRSDRHLMEGLGLLRAHQIADEWAHGDHRPLAFEIRSLHQLVASGEAHAGKYKESDNQIQGSEHRTVSALDTPHAMSELNKWWQAYSGDAILEATVVHAWLAHIHPFTDGNGRMARLLANLALVRRNYPPLIIDSETDRERYMDSLAASDNGNILPLYQQFTEIVARSAQLMQSEDYIEEVINNKLLSSSVDGHAFWSSAARKLADLITRAAESHGWTADRITIPGIDSFRLLMRRKSEGNCWFLNIRGPHPTNRWLLWCGYTTRTMLSLTRVKTKMPSIFLSQATPSGEVPFRQINSHSVPTEILLSPSKIPPVTIRYVDHIEERSPEEAARQIVHELVTFPRSRSD